MSDQTFIAPWSGLPEPPPIKLSPEAIFRIKAGVLQQRMFWPGRQYYWWINVPTVSEDTQDVYPR